MQIIAAVARTREVLTLTANPTPRPHSSFMDESLSTPDSSMSRGIFPAQY